MSSTTQNLPSTNNSTEDERLCTYVPFGEKSEIKLSLGMIKKFICKPTKQGKIASDQDIMRFMMLCKARELNPWVGDAYLVGYDAQGGPEFSLITSIQALLKRSETNPNFDGMISGVIVKVDDQGSPIEYLEGDFVPSGYKLLGGWCKVFRTDRSRPFYDALNFHVYDKGRSQWSKDPAGMIVKCAEASALRKAFPTQLGGLITQDETDRLNVVDAHVVHNDVPGPKLGSVNSALPPPRQEQPKREPAKQQPPKQEQRRQEVPAEQVKQYTTEQLAAMDNEVDENNSDDELNSVQYTMDDFEREIQASKSKESVNELYDKVFGPDSDIAWAPEDHQEGVAIRNTRLKVLEDGPTRPRRPKSNSDQLFQKGSEQPE